MMLHVMSFGSGVKTTLAFWPFFDVCHVSISGMGWVPIKVFFFCVLIEAVRISGVGVGGPITYIFSCVLKESLVATRHPLNLNFHMQLAKCS